LTLGAALFIGRAFFVLHRCARSGRLGQKSADDNRSRIGYPKLFAAGGNSSLWMAAMRL
jgi:hypothetical protein